MWESIFLKKSTATDLQNNTPGTQVFVDEDAKGKG